jgi:ATP-binding cassette subfamily C protein LapB
MVMVTYKSSLLPLATRIIVVVGNSIVMDGPRDEVLQQLQQRSAQQQQQAAAAAAASEKQEAS